MIAFLALLAFWGLVIEPGESLQIKDRQGIEKSAKLGQLVQFGEEVTSQKGKALLLLMNGSFVHLSEGKLFKADRFESKTMLLEKMNEALDQSYNLSKMGPPRANTFLEIHPPVGGIQGIYPIYGVIEHQKIHFRWIGSDLEGRRPVLLFSGIDGKAPKPIPLRTKKKGFNASKGTLDLKRGEEYRWYLGRKEGRKIIGQSRVYTFKVLSKKERYYLKKDFAKIKGLKTVSADGKDLLKAQVFYKYKMYHSMIDVLTGLNQKYGTDGIGRLLFLGYVRIGRHTKAQEFQPMKD